MRTERYDPEALITLLRQRKIATMEDLKEAQLGTERGRHGLPQAGPAGVPHQLLSHRGRSLHLGRARPFRRAGAVVVPPSVVQPLWDARVDRGGATLLPPMPATTRGAGGGAQRRGQAGPAQAGALRPPGASSRWLAAMSTFRPRRRRNAPSWPPARSTTPRPAAFPSARACGCCLTSSRWPSCFSTASWTNASSRLYAGLEAMKVGHGGDAQVAELLDIDPGTVTQGRQELLAGDIESGRVRRPAGGGRRQKKRPRGDRGDRPPDGARHRRRPGQRCEMDQGAPPTRSPPSWARPASWSAPTPSPSS